MEFDCSAAVITLCGTTCQEIQRTKTMTADKQLRSLTSRCGIKISQDQIFLPTSSLSVKWPYLV